MLLASAAQALVFSVGAISSSITEPIARDAGPVSAAHLAIEARHAGCHAVRTRVLLAVEYWPQLTRQFTLATVDDG